MDKNKKIIIALIVTVVVLLGLLRWQYSRTVEAEEIAEAVADTMDVNRNKEGQETASIKVIQAEREIALMKLEAKDTIIHWLQETVKEYRGALNTAIVLRNQTASKGYTGTTVIRDTVTINGETKIADFYETKWSNKWEEGYILARPDSIFRNIKVKNDYQITLGGVSNGWFKPKEYEVQVLNLNPNTSTRELRSFQVTNKPKRISIGLQAGYGLGLLDFKPQPYVGLGVQFNLIGVK